MEGLYYPCSKNKGADQLRGFREADLRLCFRISKKLVFSRRGSFNNKGVDQTVCMVRLICAFIVFILMKQDSLPPGQCLFCLHLHRF